MCEVPLYTDCSGTVDYSGTVPPTPGERVVRGVSYLLDHHYLEQVPLHPRGNQGANLKSISRRCYLWEVALEWELTKETIYLPLSCLQGGLLLLYCSRAWG